MNNFLKILSPIYLYFLFCYKKPHYFYNWGREEFQ